VTAFVYILLCLLWGSTWLAIKIGLGEAPPLTTAAIRFILAMLILSGIGAIKGYKYPRRFGKLIRLGYPGLYMYGISYAAVYFAEQRISSGLTATLFAAFPFMVALLSYFIYGTEKMNVKGWLGMAVGFAGVVVISWDTFQTSTDLFVGTLLALGGPLAAAYGIVLHKHHHVKENIVVAVNVQMMVGGLFLVAGALIFESFADFAVNIESIGSIVYLALFGTVITFLGYYWLVRHTKLVTVSLVAFITPLVAILIGTLVADETLTIPIAIGTLLILSGVLLVVKR